MRIFDQVYWGNRVFDYIKAAVVLFGGILFVKVIITAIVFRLKKLARKTTKTFDNLVVSVLEKLPCQHCTLAACILPSRFLISLKQLIKHLMSLNWRLLLFCNAFYYNVSELSFKSICVQKTTRRYACAQPRRYA